MRVERGLDVVVVSHLVMAETIHSLRKITTRDFSPTLDETSDTRNIRSKYKSEENRFVECVAELRDNGSAAIAKHADSMYSRHKKVFSTLRGHSGRITGGGKARYRYAGLGHADIEHARLAYRAGASKFYSADKDFAQLNANPEFEGVVFEVMSAPP